MADNRILWERPDGCSCGAALAGDEVGNGTTGDLRLVREVRPECPRHGVAEEALEAAVDAAEAIVRTVPGVPRINRPQLRRLVLAALPVLQGAVASGQLAFPPVADTTAGDAGGDPQSGRGR